MKDSGQTDQEAEAAIYLQFKTSKNLMIRIFTIIYKTFIVALIYLFFQRYFNVYKTGHNARIFHVAERGGTRPKVHLRWTFSEPSFTFFYLRLPSFTFFYLRLPSFTFFYLLLPSFTFIYLLLSSFTFFYLLLIFF